MRCIYSSAEFIANLRGPHPLFSLPGVTGDTVWADYMHSKFMGVDQYFLASVLVICVFMMIIPHCSVGAIGRIWFSVSVGRLCLFVRLSMCSFFRFLFFVHTLS